MTTQTEALKLALEAAKQAMHWLHTGSQAALHQTYVIRYLNHALAQPEQESAKPLKHDWMRDYIGMSEQPKEPEQEPVNIGRELKMDFAAENDKRLAQPEQDYPTDEHGYPIYSNGTHADIAKAHAEFEARFEPESIWIGTGHLREILNGNTLNAYCSPEQDRFTDVQLYTTPPQRKPLTDEQIAKFRRDIVSQSGVFGSVEWCSLFTRAIEAAHGIKE